jgi:hypothetical protein
MDILGVDLAYVDVDGKGTREGDDPGGRGTGIQGCDRGHCGQGWDVSVIIVMGGVGIFIAKAVGGNVVKGSSMRKCRDVGRTVCSGWWREGLEDMGR